MYCMVAVKDLITSADVQAIIKETKGQVIDLEGKEKQLFSEDFVDLLERMMAKNPKKRWSAEKLLHHRFFFTNKESKGLVAPIKMRRINSLEPITEEPKKSLDLKDLFRREWLRTMRTSAPDGRKLFDAIKRAIVANKPVSQWFISTLKKMRPRSAQNLLVDEQLHKSEERMERSQTSPARIQEAVEQLHHA
mmetsp:Transcript_31392/g.50601  ORF Transcript_31392/g.50601 Transcript_31392/m.50601 type:complete len:192 (+) Transcript_31392:1087-1662(+)